ncbi:styrene monooxygenase/indole monooxygenase family protein [Williamsia sp. D3]|uniref:styrene monooxygenase/indole monooxygenase family protein n=1 Tax=Williamsia sp. D3 TaxID=1313067 RepID=UPI0003D397B4|nr:styrene monooxygenase/indole monooxygenase family protein [Williamsia sp. D3]ETD31712.1 oxygenase [Williamsia sp. D3]
MSNTNRSVAIIGAGQTGVSAAVGFLNAGFDVTVYSERDQRSLLHDVSATGTAVTFGLSQQSETALGVDNFAGRAPQVTGISARTITGSGHDYTELLDFDAEFPGFEAIGVDTRLKVDERLTLFLEKGGRFVVENVDPGRLDSIAAENDLTFVATGKAGLSSLFTVDESRSPYKRPQRSVLLLTVAGLGHDPDVFAHRSPAGPKHQAFNFADQGEGWWGPYLHKDAGPSWSFLGWAQPGSEWERRFQSVTDAHSAHKVVIDLHREYFDWDLPEVLSTQVIEEDPHSWLQGAVTPTVRNALGHTASGHRVVALGDTAVAYDPITGQGAQSGFIQAAQFVAAAKDHEGEFDDAWITATYNNFLTSRVDAANLATRIFLRDPVFQEYAAVLFPAAATNPKFGSALFGLLSDPSPVLSINSVDDAKSLITQVTGEDADSILAKFEPAGKFSRSTYRSLTPVG